MYESNEASIDEIRLAETGDVEKFVIQKELKEHILQAISRIKKNQRMAIVLYYFQGYSCTEISEILNKPVNTIKTDLSRGRQKLKKLLVKNQIFMEIKDDSL